MEPGRRTVISSFEYYAAHEPHRVWALRPKNDDDFTAGFESIAYQTCMEAVNHAAQWLQGAIPSSHKAFDTFAYQGPSDLRVLLLCLAAAKVGLQIMLPSRQASPTAQSHLVRTSGCVALIHAKGTNPMFDPVEAGTQAIIVPELSEWLFAVGKSPSLIPPFTKSWAEAQDDPWILLHTSGTTGLPKIIRYTQKMMTKFDARPPVDEDQTLAGHLGTGSWFTPIPLFHSVGLCVALQDTAFLGAVCIIAVVTQSPPAQRGQQLMQLINQTEPYGLILPPADIEALTSTKQGWAALEKIKCITFVGAQLRKAVGDQLIRNKIKVIYGLGTTEGGPYSQVLRSDNEWDWLTFSKSAGVTLERYPGDDDVYELVLYKDPRLERFQQVFLAFPDLEVYRTKDLFYKHPTLENTWKIAGRSDDFFKLISGYGVFATPVEESILEKARHLIVKALVAGEGRESPCLIVMPHPQVRDQDLANELWPVVEEVNPTLAGMGRVRKDLILVADPTKKPFKLNWKGAVSRRETLLLYHQDIEELYNGRK